MANKKKPSIFDDRSSIGSSKELDEYGVWVKSEPQDIDTGGGFSLPDFPVDTETLPDFDLNLEDPPSFSDDFSINDDGETAPAVSGGGEDDLNIVDFDKTADEFDLDLPDLPIEETDSDLSGFSADFTDFPSEEDLTSPAGDTDKDLSVDMDIDKDITSREGLSLSEGDFDLSSDSGAGEEDAGKEPDSGGEAGFTEVPLEDILGDISMDIPTEDTQEETPAEGKQENSPESSTELLKQIVEELSSIRNELSALKDEFSVIRGQTPEPREKAGHGGFFDQGDDKIALTGDELNNIISTADFTEEAGADANEAVSGDFSGIDDLSLPGEETAEDLSVSGESGTEGDVETATGDAGTDIESVAEGDAETAAGDEVPETTDFEDLDLSFGETVNEGSDTDGLDINKDLLVEDISFEGLELEDGEDEEALDLSNAVIDEPDLGSGIQENPAEEIPEDISLNLDELEGDSLVTPDEAETESLVEEEIGLSLPEEAGEAELPADFSVEEPALDNSLEQVIPEGFAVESENSPAPFDDDIEEQESFSGAEAGELSPAEEEVDEALAGEELPPLSLEEDLSSVPEAEAEDILEESFAETSEEDLAGSGGEISGNLKQEIKTVLSYMDKLLESLPEKKIEEFAKSEYFDTYKKLFKELGLV
ncbi:MAG: hypothetical protein LBL70_06705 [Treponema sp.]|jgi:hypothetical protein|nr:hypothetical protein [Treponema sp.]